MSSAVEKKIIVLPEQEGMRLDVLLSHYLSSRSQAEKAIRQALVSKKTKNGCTVVVKPSHKIKTGECYLVPLKEEKKSEVIHLESYDHPVPVVYEDEHLLVVNKPADIVVHPGPGHEQDTLINALIEKKNLSAGTNPLRPGVVHRLDKDVSGLMLLSKTKKAQDTLIEDFKLKAVERVYRALTLGVVKKEKSPVISFIGRHPKDRKKFYSFNKEATGLKMAITHYRVLNSFQDKIHHIECRLETGRTHQIRVHLSGIGLPILGDNIYFPRRRQIKALKDVFLKKNISSLFLNNQIALYSAFLKLIHPVTQKPLSFSLPWPKEFHSLMDQMDFEKTYL